MIDDRWHGLCCGTPYRKRSSASADAKVTIKVAIGLLSLSLFEGYEFLNLLPGSKVTSEQY